MKFCEMNANEVLDWKRIFTAVLSGALHSERDNEDDLAIAEQVADAALEILRERDTP